MGISIERQDDDFQPKGSENCQDSGKKKKMLHLGSILLAIFFLEFQPKKYLKKTAIRNSRFKNCKSSKNLSCYLKRLSNKYCKNNMNNKFNKNSRLRMRKGQEGLRQVSIFHQNCKSTNLFSCQLKTPWHKYVTKIARIQI